MDSTKQISNSVAGDKPRVLRVLIVEDDPSISEILIQAVTEMGHNVVATSADGDEAVALAYSLPLDLVIMDISLPGNDGLSSIKQILQRISVPVVVSTGMVDDELLVRAQALDVQSYLIKPFTLTQLKSAIRISVALHARHESRDYELGLLRAETPHYDAIEEALGMMMVEYGDDRHTALQRLSGIAQCKGCGLVEAALSSAVPVAS